MEPEVSRAPRDSQKTLFVLAGLLVAMIVAGIVLVPRLTEGIDDASIPLGVSAHRVDGVPVFIVREKAASGLTVFLADPQHLAGEQLWWCPREEMFAGPMHGERFDVNGRDIGGPAARDLIELPATQRFGRWRIDVSSAQNDPRRNWRLPPDHRTPTSDGERAWDSGAGSFCQDPVYV